MIDMIKTLREFDLVGHGDKTRAERKEKNFSRSHEMPKILLCGYEESDQLTPTIRTLLNIGKNKKQPAAFREDALLVLSDMVRLGNDYKNKKHLAYIMQSTQIMAQDRNEASCVREISLDLFTSLIGLEHTDAAKTADINLEIAKDLTEEKELRMCAVTSLQSNALFIVGTAYYNVTRSHDIEVLMANKIMPATCAIIQDKENAKEIRMTALKYFGKSAKSGLISCDKESIYKAFCDIAKDNQEENDIRTAALDNMKDLLNLKLYAIKKLKEHLTNSPA